MAFILVSPALCFADFIDGPQDTNTGIKKEQSFLAPNELSPLETKPILANSENGVHVSVGSERSFIGFALNPNASHLLTLDRDPNVIRFNRINTALLALSKDRNDYLHLRFHSTQAEWAARAKESLKSKQISSRDFEALTQKNILTIPTAWKWWNNQVVLSPEFSVMNAKTAANSKSVIDANYMYDDAMFERLSAAAKNQKIQSIQMNFHDLERVSALTTALERGGFKVSVFDPSNAWWPDYIATPALIDILRNFAKVSTKKTILMLSERAGSSWNYLGISFGKMHDPGVVAYQLANFHHQLNAAYPGGDLEPFLRKRPAELDGNEFLGAVGIRCLDLLSSVSK